MKVKTCPQCVYTPADLGENYDQLAPLRCCADCPEVPVLKATNTYPKELNPWPSERRRACAL